MAVVAAVLTALSVVFAAAMPLCATGVVPRNRVVGLRFRPITESTVAWRIGHRAAIVPAAVTACASLVVLWMLIARSDAWVAGVFVLAGIQLGGVAWATAAGTRAVHRADGASGRVAM